MPFFTPQKPTGAIIRPEGYGPTLTRRSLVGGLLSALAAPAVLPASSLMPVRSIDHIWAPWRYLGELDLWDGPNMDYWIHRLLEADNDEHLEGVCYNSDLQITPRASLIYKFEGKRIRVTATDESVIADDIRDPTTWDVPSNPYKRDQLGFIS
jgi:hypothetical protein